MAIVFDGWTGDFTATLPGRKPLQALIALSVTGGSNLSDTLAKLKKNDGDDPVFRITPTIPGAKARPTEIGWMGPLFLTVDIEIHPIGGPWPAGPNLVHIAASLPTEAEGEPWSTGTFASIIVPAAKAPSPKKGPLPRLPGQRGT